MGKFERKARRRYEAEEAANEEARKVFEGHAGRRAVQAKLEDHGPEQAPTVHTLLDCDGNEALLCLSVLVKDVAQSMAGDPGCNLARISAMITGSAADMIEASRAGG